MLSKLYSLLTKIGNLLQPVLLLVIRLYWGWQFAIDGWGKLHNLDKVAAYFATLNLPGPRATACLIAVLQCVFGLFLLGGLFTRFAALILIGVMCGAYATAERDALHAIFSDPDKFVTATPFLFLFAAVIAFCFGPGPISLDALVFKGKRSE
jgi:putative oxidoreductase